MKETKIITLKNEVLLVRMEPELKARLLMRAKGFGCSAASLVRAAIIAYCPPLTERQRRESK